MKKKLMILSQRLRLTPFQLYVIEKNCYKYNLDKLVKQGGLLYAPYKFNKRYNIYNFFSQLFCGSRADLIGEDRMLVTDKRGIKIYNDGCFLVCRNGVKYRADSFGMRANNENVIRVV